MEITNANNVDIIVKIPNICYGCRSKISKCKDCINNDVVPDVRITIPTRGIRLAIKKTVLQLTDSKGKVNLELYFQLLEMHLYVPLTYVSIKPL